MTQFVRILKEALLATVLKDTTVMLIMDFVHQLKDAVRQIKNVDLTLSVYNQVNVFAHHHSLSMLEMFVEIHVKDLLVESMLNVLQPIHHNVCVKPALKAILYKDVQVLMNVQMPLVLMALNVLIRKVVIYANVLLVCLAVSSCLNNNFSIK